MCCSDGQTSKWPCWHSSWLNIAEVEISLREREEEVGGKREGEVGGEGKREKQARERGKGGDVIVLRFAVIVIPAVARIALTD